MKIGFIDYYLDEWHANHYPQWLREASGGEMEVVIAYGMIDSPIGGRTTQKWCSDMGIAQAESIEEVIEKSDALVVLSPDNCEMHELLCQLPLRSGKPTYVDKTFAPNYETAKRIFDIAEASGTPCYSTSALRYAEEYQGIQNVRGIVSVGPNEFGTYAIHQIEPIMMLMKAEPARVQYLPGEGWYTMAIAFKDGRYATLAGYAGDIPFKMDIKTAEGVEKITVKSDMFRGFMQHLVAFFRDPKQIVPHDETLRIMAVRGAGVKAMANPGEWVEL